MDDVLGSPGTPLDAESRAFAEPLFGQDFSHVRVHAGGSAAESARALSASAYTVGRHVVFGAGESPGRGVSGRGLLLHELAHTVQQQHAGSDRATLRVSHPADADERQADAAVHAALGGGPVSALGPTSLHVARRPKPQDSAAAQNAAPVDTMKGAQVSQIIVWLSLKRVAFQTSRGWVYGDIDTDLTDGSYELKPDIPRHRWIITKPTVKAGVRFSVDLENAIPWTLAYPATLPLTVTSGEQKSEAASGSPEGAIPDAYGVGYNTILKNAGPDSRAAVLALASLENRRLFVDLEAYKKLPKDVRKSILDLEPHAAGTGCAEWFDVMRANDPDFRPKFTPEQERAGDAAFYESMRDERLARKAEEAKQEVPALDRGKVEAKWSDNKYGLVATAQTPNNGIKAEALHQIWIKYWADKIAIADQTISAIYADEQREHKDLSDTDTFRKAKQVNDFGMFMMSQSVDALEICRAAEAAGKSLTLNELTQRVIDNAKFMEGVQVLALALSMGGPGLRRPPEPIETDPVDTDPVKTDPVKTDPVKTDPVKTDPVKTDTVKTDPVQTAKPPAPVVDPGDPVPADERPTVPPPGQTAKSAGKVPVTATAAPADPQFGKSTDGYVDDRIFRDWLPSPVPAEGWKLHVSADAASAEGAADAVLPALRGMKANHKVVGSAARYGQMSGGQAGKFITIYPNSAAEAQQIVSAIDSAVAGKGLKGVPIAGEKPVGSSGMVYTRYGGFTKSTVTDPAGREVPDQRGKVKPDWIPDPWSGTAPTGAAHVGSPPSATGGKPRE